MTSGDVDPACVATSLPSRRLSVREERDAHLDRTVGGRHPRRPRRLYGRTGADLPCAGTPGGSTSAPPPSSGSRGSRTGRRSRRGAPPDRRSRETVAFVADGNAWVLDPANGDVSCLFPAPSPGPFTWNPRGDRALLNDLEIRSIHGVQLRAASPAAAAVSRGVIRSARPSSTSPPVGRGSARSTPGPSVATTSRRSPTSTTSTSSTTRPVWPSPS